MIDAIRMRLEVLRAQRDLLRALDEHAAALVEQANEYRSATRHVYEAISAETEQAWNDLRAAALLEPAAPAEQQS